MASFSTTWLSQRYQDKTQRRAQENTRRERLYGDFIDEASKLFADALQNSLENPSKLVGLYAIFGKLRLFASNATIDAAYKVLDQIITTFYSPNQSFQDENTVSSHRLDLLHDFILSCRGDLRD